VASLSGLERAIALTEGTLTEFLEQLVGEPIDAHERHHEMTDSGVANSLDVAAGHLLLKRTVVLRGRTSATPYVYAETLLVPGRLPDEFFRRLESTSDPIGRVLTEKRIVFSRVPLPPPDRQHQIMGNEAAPSPEISLLTRAYRVEVARVPVMEISEWFLSTLRSYQGTV
jgi:chorismate-pyruvate lyase